MPQSTQEVNKPTTWETTSLKSVIEERVKDDDRFIGLKRYLAQVRIFWSTEIDTACAGHGFIFVNPAFWGKLPEETRLTVIAHEVWHLILKHLDRGEKLNHYYYNIAGDHVINLNLEAEKFTFIGVEDCFKDPKYRGKSTEQIYDLVYKEQPKIDPSKHVSSEKIEDLVDKALDADGKGKTLNEQKTENDKNVEEAQKGIGNTLGNSTIWLEVDKTKNVIIEGATYQEIFKDYLIDPLNGGQRTFMRPNRRQVAMKNNTLRLPGKYPRKGHRNRLTHLVYALDVSGSISQTEVKQSNNAVATIKRLLNPEKLTVLFFDTRITFEKTYRDRDPYIDLKVNGGGGTNLTAVYNRAKILKPEALVVFTDLRVTIPSQQDWDSIWMVPHNKCPIPANLYGSVYLIPEMVTN